MYIQDLPNGSTSVVIVYVEAKDSFIGRLDDGRLISFEFRSGNKLKKDDRVTIVKSGELYHLRRGVTVRKLPYPRASP